MSFIKDPETLAVLNHDTVGYQSFLRSRAMIKKIEELESSLDEMRSYFKEFKKEQK